MKKVKLNIMEREILAKLDPKYLGFIAEFAEGKNFTCLIEMVEMMIDQERRFFFTDQTMDPNKLVYSHALSKGGVAKLVSLVRIFQGARGEINRRKEKKEKTRKRRV